MKAIETLMQKKGRFDYILLETTGLADPAPIASIFWLDEALCSDLYLDGVVTVVDAKYASRQFGWAKEEEDEDEEEGENEGGVDGASAETAVRQLALADAVLLNKTDLVSAPALTRAERRVRRTNGSATLVRTVRGRVNLDLILDLHAYDGLSDNPEKFVAEVSVEEGGGAPHLDGSVGTVTLRHGAPVSKKALELFLERLLWEGCYSDPEGRAASVLRLKALAALRDGRVVVVQGVHDTYDTYESGAECADCTVVIIGRNLDRQVLQARFDEVVGSTLV